VPGDINRVKVGVFLGHCSGVQGMWPTAKHVRKFSAHSILVTHDILLATTLIMGIKDSDDSLEHFDELESLELFESLQL
jgi:hypothetical protein